VRKKPFPRENIVGEPREPLVTGPGDCYEPEGEFSGEFVPESSGYSSGGYESGSYDSGSYEELPPGDYPSGGYESGDGSIISDQP